MARPLRLEFQGAGYRLLVAGHLAVDVDCRHDGMLNAIAGGELGEQYLLSVLR